MVCKPDMENAYDHVNWNSPSISWVIMSLGSTGGIGYGNVLANIFFGLGEWGSEGSRGLRQGTPYPPSSPS